MPLRSGRDHSGAGLVAVPSNGNPGCHDRMPPSEPAIFDPPAGSVRRAAGRGALATGIAQLIRFGTQLLSLVILSRLLTPQDFGVIAMAAASCSAGIDGSGRAYVQGCGLELDVP